MPLAGIAGEKLVCYSLAASVSRALAIKSADKGVLLSTTNEILRTKHHPLTPQEQGDVSTFFGFEMLEPKFIEQAIRYH